MLKKRGRRKFEIEGAGTEEIDGGIPHTPYHVSVSVSASVSLSEKVSESVTVSDPDVIPVAWDLKGNRLTAAGGCPCLPLGSAESDPRCRACDCG